MLTIGGSENKVLTSNQKRAIKRKFNPKFSALLPTIGFNNEIFSDRIDYACWDIGGTCIFAGEQDNEYFGQGSSYEINSFLKLIPVHGLIWVVNVSQDIEYLLQSKA